MGPLVMRVDCGHLCSSWLRAAERETPAQDRPNTWVQSPLLVSQTLSQTLISFFRTFWGHDIASGQVTTAGFESTNMTVTAWGTELTPTNGSDQALSKWDKETVTPDVLVFTLALVGLAGNAVVLWLLGFRMRRNAFSVYILNLAGADFLFLCCRIIYSLRTFISNFHSRCISIPYIFITVSNFAYISGLSFLSAISTERCLAVLWPFWYRSCRPRHLSAITCALLWALSLLLSILEGNYCGFLLRKRDQTWCRAFDFIIVVWLILLFVLLSGSSLALLTRLLGSQRVPLTRLYVVILLTVLVFLVCSLAGDQDQQ